MEDVYKVVHAKGMT